MNNMAKLDKNFIVQTKIEHKDILFYSANSEYFSLHGVFYENGKYRRMPEGIAKQVSEGIKYSHTLTAGGRLRFVTDSNYVALSVHYGSIERASNFTLTGTTGFDLYERTNNQQIYVGSFIPPIDVTDTYESVIDLTGLGEHELTLTLPLYSEIQELYIGISKDAMIKPAPEYKYPSPIVYYGSSITHGACASRPGNTYPAMISRKLDCDYINLGFGGNAKAEDAIADYIAHLDMSVFVFDYNYNAPSLDHLKKTHDKMFQTIRASQPNLPIVIMSRPKNRPTETEKARFEIIQTTYKKAIAKGDENVYFIPGYELVHEDAAESSRVDKHHPNDLGFYFIAERVSKELMKILK